MIDDGVEGKSGTLGRDLVEHLGQLVLEDHHCGDLGAVCDVHEDIPVIHFCEKSVAYIDECSARTREDDISTVYYCSR